MPEIGATFDQLDAIVAGIGRKAYGNPNAMGFKEFCQRTLPFELHPWQEIVCDKLEEAYREGGKKILIAAPPRFGKTIILSQRYPAWVFGMNPLRRVVLASFNIENAVNHASVARDLVNTEEYKQWFPETRLPAQTTVEAYSTTAMLDQALGEHNFAAVGIKTNFVGKGADDLLVDDPYPSFQEATSKSYNEFVWNWWENVVNVRVYGKANKIVMFHRWHDDDFAARLLAKEDDWEYLRFPAVADGLGNDPTNREVGELLSPMWTREALEKMEQNSPRAFLSLFQGTPRPPEGAYIKSDYFQTATIAPRLKLWVRYFDLATTTKTRGDYTAGALVGVDETSSIFVKDMVRFKKEWPDAAPAIMDIILRDMAMAQKEGARYIVGIDSRSMQLALFQDLVRRATPYNIPVVADQTKGDKAQRADGWVARASQGKLFLVPGWNHQAFIDECLSFIPGADVGHDDQIDAVSGAFGLLWASHGTQIHDPKEYVPNTWAYFQKLGELERERRRANAGRFGR